MQKGKITDYDSFKNEIAVLKCLVHFYKSLWFYLGPSQHYQAHWNMGNRQNLLSYHRVNKINTHYWLLSRLCEGGELFYHITKTKMLTEAQASVIMK